MFKEVGESKDALGKWAFPGGYNHGVAIWGSQKYDFDRGPWI
jgi:hypothetical protein